MAVAFGALGAKSAGGTTTVSIAYPASVGAGDMVLSGRNLWQSGSTFLDEAGWTNTAELGGGTGASADGHTGKIRVDRLQAAGGETGSVTFDQGNIPSGCIGQMIRYTKDAGETWDVAAATGTTSTHAANRSVTSSTNISLQTGDVVVAVVAVDTDTLLASFGSLAFSATGITFSGVTRRTASAAGTTQGLDGNIEIFEATVASGSGTVAVTCSFNTTTNQCGPIGFVRLRAASATPDVAAAPTYVVAASGVSNVGAQADIAPRATLVTAHSAAGNIGIPAVPDVAGAPTYVGAYSAQAGLTATAQIAPAPTYVTAWSAAGNVTATAGVAPRATYVVVVAAAANLTTTAGVAPRATYVVTVAAAGNVTTTANVAPSPTLATVFCGVADVGTSTTVGAAPSYVTAWSAQANTTTTAGVSAAPTLVTAWAAAANVIATAGVSAAPTFVAALSAVADTASTVTTNVNPAPTYVQSYVGMSDMVGHASIVAASTYVGAFTGLGDVTGAGPSVTHVDGAATYVGAFVAFPNLSGNADITARATFVRAFSGVPGGGGGVFSLLDSLEHVIRGKVETHYSLAGLKRDIGYLLRKWRGDNKAAHQSGELGHRTYWTTTYS